MQSQINEYHILKRVFEIDVGILKELEERAQLVSQLQEMRYQQGRAVRDAIHLDTETLLKQIHQTAPELTLPDEKILQLWGKVVEVTGSDYSESGPS